MKIIKDIFKTVDETSPEAFGIKSKEVDMYLGPLEDPPSESNTPQEFRVGDTLSVRGYDARIHNGIVDTIEWSATFKTWCYRLVSGNNTPYWVYQKTNQVSHQFSVVYSKHSSPLQQRLQSTSFARRVLAIPPRPLPAPKSISE